MNDSENTRTMPIATAPDFLSLIDEIDTAARLVRGTSRTLNHFQESNHTIQADELNALAHLLEDVESRIEDVRDGVKANWDAARAREAQLHAELATLKVQLDNTPQRNLDRLQTYSDLLGAAARATIGEVERVARGEPAPSVLSLLQQAASFAREAAQ